MKNIGIIGAGNIGGSIARGLINFGGYLPGQIHITRKNSKLLDDFRSRGMNCYDDNLKLVDSCDMIIITVLPGQIQSVIEEIKDKLDYRRQILVSVVPATTIMEIGSRIGQEMQIVRAMPNTAIEYGESMTCIAGNNPEAEKVVEDVFSALGSTMIIQEKLMPAATIMAACGIAFFLRFIRAQSQGGIQIGFHANEAGKIAAQTAKGAAEIILSTGNHPEEEIDRVTTPMGCTIAGLNEMEHYGLSSALIKGIITSYAGISDLK